MVCVVAWGGLPAGATAQSPQGSRITLTTLTEEVLQRNPEIAAARTRHEAAMQRPAQERSLPDPMISTGYSAAGKPFPGAGLGSDPNANIGAMVTQELPYPGKLRIRADMATREADAVLQDAEGVKLDVLSRVKQVYFRLSYAHAAAGVLSRNQELLQTLLKVTESRYSVGGAAQQDVFKAQTELSMIELQLERLTRERVAREGEINALRDRPVGTAVGEPEEPALVPVEKPVTELVTLANERSPMLRRDRAMVARAELAVEAARKDYKPDFAVSGGYFFMGSMPAMYELRFDVILPLRKARRAAAVAEQSSTLSAAKQTVDATRLSLQAAIQEDHQMAASSLRLATLYRETVLPQARLALESSLASYETGGVEFLSVLTNFAAILELEMRYFEEVAALHAAISRLEAMTGTPLVH